MKHESNSATEPIRSQYQSIVIFQKQISVHKSERTAPIMAVNVYRLRHLAPVLCRHWLSLVSFLDMFILWTWQT